MSFKRVVLIAALMALAMPAAAFADGITFGFSGDNGVSSVSSITVTRPFTLGGVAATSGTISLTYLTKMLGPVPFGPVTTPTFGVAPNPNLQVPNTGSFGTLSFTTGAINLANGVTSASFAPGGAVLLVANAALAAATGGAIPNGNPIFTGSFTGTATMVQTTTPTGCQPTVKFCYVLSGVIGGTLSSQVLSYFGLGNNPNSNGLLLTLTVGFNDVHPPAFDSNGNIEGGMGSLTNSTVPEPGTLALFGTGLISIAGFVRRRFKS